MCDHYDSYYRETPEEARASKIAAKKEAARRAEYEKERELKLARDFQKRFPMNLQDALVEVRKIKFVIGWRG